MNCFEDALQALVVRITLLRLCCVSSRRPCLRPCDVRRIALIILRTAKDLAAQYCRSRQKEVSVASLQLTEREKLQQR
jgi:hypothetical protein